MKIGVVITSRSDSGILEPFMRMVQDRSSDCELVVLDLSFVTPFIDDEQAICARLGRIAKVAGWYFAKSKCDCVVVLGDRSESFIAAAATHIFRIPIVHIHGGEVTEGAYDDAFRHSISK